MACSADATGLLTSCETCTLYGLTDSMCDYCASHRPSVSINADGKDVYSSESIDSCKVGRYTTQFKQVTFPYPSEWQQPNSACDIFYYDANRTNIACILVPLDPASKEYATVASSFIDTGMFVVNSIRRVQNSSNYVKFMRKRCELINMYGDANMYEACCLYHTPHEGDLSGMLVEGLDNRVSTRGNFGLGVYTTDCISKADSYNRRKSPRPRIMFQCSVVLGRPEVYNRGVIDMYMRREHIGYDSVIGYITANEFVVYNREQCNIDYVIEYTEKPLHTKFDPCAVHTAIPDTHDITNYVFSLSPRIYPIGTVCYYPEFGLYSYIWL